jgi:hypothetical protein
MLIITALPFMVTIINDYVANAAMLMLIMRARKQKNRYNNIHPQNNNHNNNNNNRAGNLAFGIWILAVYMLQNYPEMAENTPVFPFIYIFS